MRIAMVTTFYPPFNFGGDGIFVQRLTHALARRGHTVEVIHDVDAYLMTGGSEPAVTREPTHPNVIVHPLRGGFGARADLLLSHQLGRPVGKSAQLHALLDRDDFDVIHFHNISLVGGPGVLAYGTAVKLCTMHEYWFVCPMHVLWRYDREACESPTCIRCTLHGKRPPQLWRYGSASARNAAHVDAFITPSESAKRILEARGFPEPIHVLPHFVPGTPASSPAAPPASRRPYFVCAGRLEKLKGIESLLHVFRGIEGADLVIAGEGSLTEMVLEAAGGERTSTSAVVGPPGPATDSRAHIRYVGKVSADDLHRLYAGALATIVPSFAYETFGLVALESMACGTPAIVRNRGALPELIEQTGGGLVFDDDAALPGAIRTVINDAPLRARMAEAGFRASTERFSEEGHVQAYFELIERVRR